MKKQQHCPRDADLDRIGRSIQQVWEHCSFDELGNQISCCEMFHCHIKEQRSGPPAHLALIYIVPLKGCFVSWDALHFFCEYRQVGDSLF